jgi:hypothetical protein
MLAQMINYLRRQLVERFQRERWASTAPAMLALIEESTPDTTALEVDELAAGLPWIECPWVADREPRRMRHSQHRVGLHDRLLPHPAHRMRSVRHKTYRYASARRQQHK